MLEGIIGFTEKNVLLELKDMLNYIKKKQGLMPEGIISKKMKESELLRQIKDFLDAKKIMYIRLNSGAFRTERGFYRMSEAGIADLVIIKNGKVYWVELKANKNNKQSDSQKVFESRLKKAGGNYYLIYSLEELIKIIS
jgi:hypothetical protein